LDLHIKNFLNYFNPISFAKDFSEIQEEFDRLEMKDKILAVACSILMGVLTTPALGLGSIAAFRKIVELKKQPKVYQWDSFFQEVQDVFAKMLKEEFERNQRKGSLGEPYRYVLFSLKDKSEWAIFYDRVRIQFQLGIIRKDKIGRMSTDLLTLDFGQTTTFGRTLSGDEETKIQKLFQEKFNFIYKKDAN